MNVNLMSSYGGVFPRVGKKALDADVGQGVLEHRLQHGVGHRGDVGAGLRRLHDVGRVADAGRQHLGRQVVAVEYLHRLADDLHSILAGVVQAADEGADVRGAGEGGGGGLGGGG